MKSRFNVVEPSRYSLSNSFNRPGSSRLTEHPPFASFKIILPKGYVHVVKINSLQSDSDLAILHPGALTSTTKVSVTTAWLGHVELIRFRNSNTVLVDTIFIDINSNNL